jgi:uncharacterized protein (TIGR03083 family)
MSAVMDDTSTWKLIHRERASIADTLATLTPSQWAQPSLCDGWTVRIAASHIVTGAEQTKKRFVGHMFANGFRFNKMMDRDAKRVAARAPDEIIARLRARVTTTNHPPAPVITMLGEVVVHSDDIRRPLGLESDTSPEALVACLDMYKTASFPVGTKKRIEGLRLVATDVGWAHGTGPEVTGPAMPLLMAMTGRTQGLDGLAGEGLATLRNRMTSTG